MPGFKRPPIHFRSYEPSLTLKSLHARYAALSKADWADAFCDLYQQVFGEQSTPEAMLADAEGRIANLKLQGVR